MTPGERVSYRALLRNGNFLRFFLAQIVSSLGDWVGVIALAAVGYKLGGDPAVGAVMMARLIPGFVVGPAAGVLVDRWDRKRTMVTTDFLRAVVIFSIPFLPNLLYLMFAAAVLESLTLIWAPAKDASLPNFVEPAYLGHANSLALMAVYGPWPLAAIVFGSLATLGAWLGDTVPLVGDRLLSDESLALWLDSLTFVFSAVMISTLAIRTSTRRVGKLDLAEAKRDLVEGLRFVRDHKQVRPWLLGIAGAFTAAGGVFSLGIGFTDKVLGAGERGFAGVVGFLAVGMIAGLIAVGFISKRIQKDVLFSSSLLLLGVALIAFASMGSLEAALPIATALGFFGGAAYSTGYSLMHETTHDELRGRTFSAAYTTIRLGTLVGLGIFPFLAGAIGDHQVGGLDLPGSRVTFWFAGLVVVGGAILSMRAINARSIGREEEPITGYFIVFEGGEGAGKSTQIDALVSWLEARGEDVVVTREPGGTDIGRGVRDILLNPANRGMDARTEALLYAADRSQHVAEVVLPALKAGKIVISDRFVDSSLAYQGLARGLGLEEIYGISDWATGGLVPDLVFFMQLDATTGLERKGQERDRIELEDEDFHRRVLEGYLHLAQRFPERFVVLDASQSQSEIHDSVVTAFEEKTSQRVVPLSVVREAGAPGTPIRR